jgi:hypothetical protein
MSLNTLADCLGELGRREAALAVAVEAVDLLRSLAAKNPEAFEPDLAMMLSNLSAVLRDSGEREAA